LDESAGQSRDQEGDTMSKKRIRKAGALGAVLALLAAGPAYAVGGPNSPGNSGHFNPNSAPCQGPNDQPNCPGPQH
jgi:hypothetical protein